MGAVFGVEEGLGVVLGVDFCGAEVEAAGGVAVDFVERKNEAKIGGVEGAVVIFVQLPEGGGLDHLFVLGGAAGGLELLEGGAVLIEQAGEALLVEGEFGQIGYGVGGVGEQVCFEGGDAAEAPVLGDDGVGERGFQGAGGGEFAEHGGAELFEGGGVFVFNEGVDLGGEAVGGGVEAGFGLAFGGAGAGGMLGVGAVDFGAGAGERGLGRFGVGRVGGDGVDRLNGGRHGDVWFLSVQIWRPTQGQPRFECCRGWGRRGWGLGGKWLITEEIQVGNSWD